ncbi:hypothetical protein GG344DRAFT_70277 [Lentinula edodes]|nr:hypothetical protein GG344DRAFT_70277 [Lentinula edodes]
MRISIIISLLLGLVPVICAAPQPVKLDGGSVALQGIQTRNKVHKGTTEAPLKFTVTFSGETAYGKVGVRHLESDEEKMILKQLVGSIFAMEVVKAALGTVQATVGGDPLIGGDTLVGDDDGQILFDITGDPNIKECIHGVICQAFRNVSYLAYAKEYAIIFFLLVNKREVVQDKSLEWNVMISHYAPFNIQVFLVKRLEYGREGYRQSSGLGFKLRVEDENVLHIGN